nr:MAG TPA: hypothetical protein [Caudoviricetes sp.]
MPCRITSYFGETPLFYVLRISNISCAIIKVNTKVIRFDKNFYHFYRFVLQFAKNGCIVIGIRGEHKRAHHEHK